MANEKRLDDSETIPVLVTPERLAEAWGVGTQTVRRWMREGGLPGFKLGRSWRVRLSDVHRLFERGNYRIEGINRPRRDND